MKVMEGKRLEVLNNADSWQGELVRFVALAILGTAASYLSVNIPYTEALIEGRWIFGYMGFALLNRWWAALMLACFLSVVRPYGLSLGTVLVGNMLYAFPFLLVIRVLYRRVMERWRTVAGYGLAWLLIILIGYQTFTTPAIWGFLAFLHDDPIWPAVLEGWREQPYLVESLLVGIISALAMMVVRSNRILRASRQELATTLYSIGDGVIATDADGRIRRMNPVAEQLTGWSEAEAAGRPLGVVFDIIDEETRRPVESPVARVFQEGVIVGLANHTLLISKGGRAIPIADSGAPMFDPQGNITGVVLVFRDQSEERLNQRLTQARLALITYAATHTLDELLTRALDQAGAFVDSPIGFYSFVGPDEKTLSLQQWSTRTLQEFCQAEGRGMHYGIDKAGVWVDCVYEKKPVVHNDYASLPHKKGMPEGHAKLIRELVVPVMRQDKVVAVLAVGNKPTEYTQKDIEIVSYLADVTWEIIRQKRAEAQRAAALETLRESKKQYQHLFNSIADAVFVHDLTGRILDVNHSACIKYGYREEEMLQMNASDVDVPEHATCIEARMQKLLERGEIVFETVHLDREKNRIPMEVTAKLADYKGQQVVISICHDITERVRAESQREAALNALQAKSDEQALLLDTMDAQVWYLTDAETYGMVNRAHAEFLGLRREDIEHKRLFEFLQQEVAQVCKESNRQVFETKQTIHTEEWVPNAEGEKRLIAITKTPHLDQQENVAYVVCVGTDITARKQMEEALRESEEKYRALIVQSADCLILHDMDARIIEVNPWSCYTYGYSRQELLQMKISDLDPDYVAREDSGEFWDQLSPGEPVMFEARQQKKDGTIFPVEVRLSLVKLHGQTLALGLCRDITERKQSESQREAALEALRESEEKYRLLAETTRDIILLHDMDGRILYLNQAGLDFAGLERSNATGRSIAAFVPAEHQAELTARRTQRAGGDKLTRLYKTEFLNRAGERVPVEVNSTPLLHEGRVRGILVVARDITERMQAESQREAALKERERLTAQVHEQARQMEQVLDTVPAGVLLLDAAGRILQANPVAEKDLVKLAGVKVGQALTHLGERPLPELLTSPPTKGLWHQVEADGRIFEVIARPMESALPQGDVLMARQARPAGLPKENDVELEHWVLVVNDVTQEREVRKRLEGQERLAAVGQLAAGIAHDFNNIMATIILYTRMIERAETLSERDRERLSVVSQQAWHASRLIEQILDFSRRAVLERRPLDLLPLLKEQVKLLKRTLPEHIEIDLYCGQDEYIVNADPTRIQQMLTNLAVNARDAMPGGGTLHVGLERVIVEAGEWIRLTVSDTGTGITPEVLPHIFEPFFTTKEPGQGSGLGLAQIHGIVGQHGGRIDVTTEVGKGTTFTIYLPALAVRPAEPSPPGVSTIPQGRGEIVLVVEDGKSIRAALVESLEGLNYQALEAANGQEALALMGERGEHVVLVLSDVVMPGMGGIALFRALREKGWQMPVILLTGHPMGKELDELQAEGLSAWLTKPPSLERLAQVIDEALRN